MRLLIASGNVKKVVELRRLVAAAGLSLEVVGLGDVATYPEPKEDGDTFEANALLKARAGAAATGLPTLADDSGIEVDALGGRPGPRSARFAGDGATDAQNLQALIQGIRGVPGSGRSARYRCAAAMSMPDGEVVYTEAVCEGTLRTTPAGEGGFGYDPIFVPVGWDVTMAELTDEQKDRISHRGRAFRALLELLERT